MRTRLGWALPLAVTIGMTAAAVGVSPAAPAPALAAAHSVDPPDVELTLGPGQSATVAKRVTTPAVPPNPDIVLLADTTGGMDPALANVRNNTDMIINRIRESQPGAQFAVAEYKDQVDGPRVFTVNTPLTADSAAVRAGTQEWLFNAGGGGAPWTDYINAHHRIATDAIAFRPSSSRIIAWFGDASSRDPSLGHTLSSTTAALRASQIRVVAVPVTGTPGDGLDRLGQASSITSATRGRLMPDRATDQVAQALLDGIQSLDSTVTPRVVSCDPQLTVTFDPESRTVRSGTEAAFTETIGVRPDAAAGTYHCSVDFLVEGLSQGFVQNTTVHVPGLHIGDVTVAEGDTGTTQATFNVSLDRPAASPVTVRWATTDGTATAADNDYTAGSGELTFPPGTTSQPITVPVVGDTRTEPDETFTVTLSTPSGAAIADGSGVGTITNDDESVRPGLGVDDVTVVEGATGVVQATFTVSLDRPSADSVSVQWATADGTATVADNDYTSGSGEVVFSPGVTSQPVTVAVIGDTVVEPDETFTLNLSDAVGADIVDGSGVGTITNDDDSARPELSIGDATLAEGDSGVAQATFSVSLDQPSTTEVSVRWVTFDGTATAPADYTAGSGELSFAPGTTSQQIAVGIVGDTVVEPDETFTVGLSDAVNADIADGTGVGTILNDDALVVPPNLSIGDVTVAEGDTGTVEATFTVSLDRAAAEPASVHFATADGTATAPNDYTTSNGQLTFAPGETTNQVTVPVVGDTTDEPDETFTVVLSAPVGATIGDGTGVGTIVDDDVPLPPPALSIVDVTVIEGNTGTTAATFTVGLNRPATTPVTVRTATTDRTAVAPADYTAGSGELTFAPGETTRQVTVPVVGDTTDEPDETFTVVLSAPVGATIGDGTGVGTIVDDDRNGSFSCTASALDLLGTRPAVANPAIDPCRDHSATAASVNLGALLLSVRSTGLTASTDQTPDDLTTPSAAGDNATATARVATTRISAVGVTIELGVIQSHATAECLAGPSGLAPRFSAGSTITSLKINGIVVPVGSGPVTIPLVIGTLRLNATTTTPTSVTQRALELDTALADVIIGEAHAGIRGTAAHPTGNPCQR